MLDLAGSQWSETESEALKWHVSISLCVLCTLIVPESIIQSHCSEKYPIVFFALKMKQDGDLPVTIVMKCASKRFSS